jgi:hypothetical protein
MAPRGSSILRRSWHERSWCSTGVKTNQRERETNNWREKKGGEGEEESEEASNTENSLWNICGERNLSAKERCRYCGGCWFELDFFMDGSAVGTVEDDGEEERHVVHMRQI